MDILSEEQKEVFSKKGIMKEEAINNLRMFSLHMKDWEKIVIFF